MKLYLDSCAIIYSIEGASSFRNAMLSRISQIEQTQGGTLVTSRLSRLECRVKPLRDGNAALLEIYDLFFSRALLKLIELQPAIIERATEIRARHNLRTADALHVASAMEEGADALLTGDTTFPRCPGIRIEVIQNK